MSSIDIGREGSMAVAQAACEYRYTPGSHDLLRIMSR
jgi:hypothetical protein